MFFILSKILAFTLNPGFWILCLLGASLYFKKQQKKWLLVTLTVFVFFSNGFILNLFVRFYESKPSQLIEKEYDYAIVLGGYSSYNFEYERVEFGSATDRLMTPLQMYYNGKVKKLILSGGSGELLDQTYSEQEKVAAFLISMGISAEDILIEYNSKNTYENAVFTQQLIAENQLHKHSFLLVTSAMHMPRSIACFRKTGLNPVPLPVDFASVSIKEKASLNYLLIPDLAALLGWQYVLHEWIGYIVYKSLSYL
jgi:uncharacterized SAM-binding protein YcdF (DUF218 family)